jgi:hypothetical protein
MAESTTTPAESGAPDAGQGEQADIDAQLSSFIIDSDGEETEFVPGEDPEAVEEPPAEGEEVETQGETKEAAPEEKTEEPLKWTVKVNGNEFEVDEKELIRGYQMGQAAQQKFQEAATMRGQAEKLIELLKTDPLAILTNPALGINFRELAENYLVEQLKMEQADPVTRAQMMADAKLKELQLREKQLNEAQEQRLIAQQTEVARQQIDAQFTQALGKASIPKTPMVVKRMAEIASELIDQGYDASADELVDLVRQEIIQNTKALAAGMNPQELAETLGQDKMKEARQAAVAKSKTVKPSVKQFKPPPAGPKKKYISERELRAEVDKALGRSR